MATQVFAIVSYPSDKRISATASRLSKEPSLSFRVRRVSIERGNRPVGRALKISIAVNEIKSLRGGGWCVKGHSFRGGRPYESEAGWYKKGGTNRLHIVGYGY